MLNKKEAIYTIFFTLVVLVCFVFFSIADYDFTASLYTYRNWEMWVYRFSVLPAFCIAWVFSLQLSAFSVSGRVLKDEYEPSALHTMLGLIGCIVIPIYLFTVVRRYFSDVIAPVGWIMLFILIVLCVAAVMRLQKNYTLKEKKQRADRALVGLLSFLALLIISLLLAVLRQRVSFRALLVQDELLSYTAWYQDFFKHFPDFTKKQSLTIGCFPSVQVTLSYALCIGVYLMPGTNRRRRNNFVVISIFYGTFISLVTLLCGCAYMTDIIFSFLLSFGTILLGGAILHRFFPEAVGTLYVSSREEGEIE